MKQNKTTRASDEIDIAFDFSPDLVFGKFVHTRLNARIAHVCALITFIQVIYLHILTLTTILPQVLLVLGLGRLEFKNRLKVLFSEPHAGRPSGLATCGLTA